MKIKTIVAAFMVSASLLASGAVFTRNYTDNVDVSSNYIWRGVTQTSDQSAVSGGIDWAHPSGVYIGGWTSNLDGNDYELDLYGGYGFNAGDVDLDVGFINYRYPVSGTTPVLSDFAEIYVNATMKNYTAGAALTVSKQNTSQDTDIYLYGTGEFEVKKGLILAVTVGTYNFDDSAAEDYIHVRAAVSKDDFTFAIDKNDLDKTTGPDSMRISVSWSKSIDF